MKKIAIAFAFVAVTVIAFWIGRQSEQAPAPTVDSGPPPIAADPTAIASPDGPNVGGAPPAESASSDAVFRAYKCPDSNADKCEYMLGAATSAAEAQWLERMGYPTAAQTEEFSKMPLCELKRLSDAKNNVATVFYGKKLVEAGQGLIGLGVMQQAAVRGSIYANHVMAEALLDKNSGVSDPIEGKARLRLAYLLGDWKASYPLSSSLAGSAAPLEVGIVDRRAMRLYEGLLSAKYREHVPVVFAVRPTSPDPL